MQTDNVNGGKWIGGSFFFFLSGTETLARLRVLYDWPCVFLSRRREYGIVKRMML